MRFLGVILVLLIGQMCGFSQDDDFLLPVKSGGKWGYIDKNGNLLVLPAFDKVQEFSDGFGMVFTGDKVGLINAKGKMVLNAVYDQVKIENVPVSTSGIPYSALFLHEVDGKWGCSDINGNTVLENIYSQILVQDLIMVKENIDSDFYEPVLFNEALQPQVKDIPIIGIDQSSSYYVFTSPDNFKGLMGVNGNIILPPVYKKIRHATGKLFQVTESTRIGIADTSGKILIEPTYDFINDFKKHLAKVLVGLKYGLINDQGEVLLEPEYNQISIFEGKVKARKGTDMVMLEIDTLGNVLEHDEFKNVRTISVESYFEEDADLIFQNTNADTTYVDDVWYKDDSLKKWGLLNADGDTLLTAVFSKVYSNRYNDLAIVEISRKDTARMSFDAIPFESVMGILNEATGKLVVPIRYFNVCLRDFLDTSRSVVRGLSLKGEWGYFTKNSGYEFHKALYIDSCGKDMYKVLKSGKLTSKASKYDDAYYLNTMYKAYSQFTRGTSYSISTYRSLYCANAKWQYMIGDSLHPEVYQYAGDFKNGRAIAKQDGKWGVIDEELKVVIPFLYDSITVLFKSNDSLFKLYVKNQKKGLMTADGEVLTDMIYEDIDDYSNGYSVAKKRSKYGFLDQEGKEITEFIYSKASDFSEGLAAVKKGKLWGYIDTVGNLMIEPEFKTADDFSDGMAYVSYKKGSGYINTSGDLVFEMKCIRNQKFRNGVAWVKERGKYGLIDKTGKRLIKPKFAKVLPFDDTGELTVASQGGRMGIVDNNGRTVTPFKYSYIGTLSGSGFAVISKNDKYGFIDEDGRVCIDADYDAVNDFKFGYALVKKNDRYHLISKEGGEAENLVKSDCIQKQLTQSTETKPEIKNIFTEYELDHASNTECELVFDIADSTKYYLKSSTDKYNKYYLVKVVGEVNTPVQVNVIKSYRNTYALGGELLNYYDKITSVGDGLYSYGQKMVYGIADLDGNLIFEPNFENISYCGDDVYKILHHNLICYLNKDGSWIWKPVE